MCVCVCVCACVRARAGVWCSVSRYVCACSRKKSQGHIAIIPPTSQNGFTPLPLLHLAQCTHLGFQCLPSRRPFSCHAKTFRGYNLTIINTWYQELVRETDHDKLNLQSLPTQSHHQVDLSLREIVTLKSASLMPTCNVDSQQTVHHIIYTYPALHPSDDTIPYLTHPNTNRASWKTFQIPKYPWTRDVTWVKFPTNSTTRETWKKLLRSQANLKSRLVRDCFHVILTREQLQKLMMDMQ